MGSALNRELREVFRLTDVRLSVVSVPVAAQVVTLALEDPDRVSIIFSPQAGANALVWPASALPGVGQGLAITGTTAILMFSQREHGGLVGRQWVGTITLAAGNIAVIETLIRDR